MNDQSAKQLILYLKMYSRMQMLTIRHVKQWACQMDLDHLSFRTDGTVHRKLLDLIVKKDEETEKEMYTEKDLVTLCLLLGSGNTQTKAELLYDEWDEDCNGVLTLEEFNTAIEQLLTMSIELINLADGTGAEYLTEEKRGSYIAQIRKNEEKAKCEIVEILYGEKTEVARQDFIDLVSKSSAKEILTSYRLRQFYAAYDKSVPEDQETALSS